MRGNVAYVPDDSRNHPVWNKKLSNRIAWGNTQLDLSPLTAHMRRKCSQHTQARSATIRVTNENISTSNFFSSRYLACKHSSFIGYPTQSFFFTINRGMIGVIGNLRHTYDKRDGLTPALFKYNRRCPLVRHRQPPRAFLVTTRTLCCRSLLDLYYLMLQYIWIPMSHGNKRPHYDIHVTHPSRKTLR